MLLDTNVMSELMRPAPGPAVAQWLHSLGDELLSATVIIVSEIVYGPEKAGHWAARVGLAGAI